ncbi:MAG TPA: ATP-dependent metallopeptidase FtsH/Yme1/Tma family protein, partial [Acidimicrobiales bacterium]
MLGGVLVLALATMLIHTDTSGKSLAYSDFMSQAKAGKVATASYNNTNGKIDGKFTDGTKYHTTGLIPFPGTDLAALRAHKVELTPKTP